MLETTTQLFYVLLVAAIFGAAAICPSLLLFFWTCRSYASVRITKDLTRAERCHGRPINNETTTMTFEHIAYFLALAAEGTFVAAAQRCGISQPSLTNAIKSLETTLGAQLFERTATGSELTAFGRQMYPLLARLHHDRIRALTFARTLDFSANRIPAAPPRPALPKYRPMQGGGVRKSNRRTVTLALLALLACMMTAMRTPTQASDKDVEATIRDKTCALLPHAVRISHAFNQ